MVVWVADRCTRLGERLHDLRRGLLPILAICYIFFGLIALETDVGGALLFLTCFTATLWVGGARSGQSIKGKIEGFTVVGANHQLTNLMAVIAFIQEIAQGVKVAQAFTHLLSLHQEMRAV